jgi:hypothetical protein
MELMFLTGLEEEILEIFVDYILQKLSSVRSEYKDQDINV